MNTTSTLNDLEKRSKLTALWLFVLLCMIFRDLHQLGHPGFIEQMMSGVVDGVTVTEGLMLAGGMMITVPLLAIPLTHFLSVSGSRLANLCIGILHLVITIGVNGSPDLDDGYFALVEVAALSLTLQQAWVWKSSAVVAGTSGKEQSE